MHPSLMKCVEHDRKYNEKMFAVGQENSGGKGNGPQKVLPEIYKCNVASEAIKKSGKDPELTVQMFFEFMRTAYRVNDSFPELASVLTAKSEIDWTELAKIDLNNQNSPVKEETENVEEEKKISEEKVSQSPSASSPSSSGSENCANELVESTENSSPKKIRDGSASEEKIQSPEIPAEECPLGKSMKKLLSDILHEGLLDSVLPYMLPKTAVSQPIIRKPMSLESKKVTSLASNLDGKVGPSAGPGNRDKEKSKGTKKSVESEVEIHVCDEAKNLKKDFRCPQKLLIGKMRYFADVTAGQKLEEMDISVHCDIVIFDWLMRWVKKDIIKKSEWPVLEASNVIPIMVSASFLQMEPLLEQCLAFAHENMSEVLKTLTVLTCLNDNIFTRLADLFTNSEVEALKDKKDKIQSRLFCKLIVCLVQPSPNNTRGHYGSLATLFKCGKCGKIVIRSASDAIPCIPSAMRLDTRGDVHSKHSRDPAWSLNEYVMSLRSELRSWRKVYWRLWGDCHFLNCRQCETYFPINQMDWCSYHSEVPQFFVNEQHKNSAFPLGRYPCCSQRAYRFESLPNKQGCRFKEHIPVAVSGNEADILTIFANYRDVISLEPPQLFFPENATRLGARDPSLQPGKLSCKDPMWWNGIELLPPRQKLGLLGKIWGGSGLRRACPVGEGRKTWRKLRQQGSQITDPTSQSSGSESDEEGASGRDSSIDEDSENSEESRAWPSEKRNSRVYARKRTDGGRSWSANLLARYNQDNQRDYEEKAGAQMSAFLTKRTTIETGLLARSSKMSQNWASQPIGGTYVRLEAEFRERSSQYHRCKTAAHVKGSNRAHTSKMT